MLFTPVVALAGITTPDIDIIFNRLLPGPIPAGDDTSTELFPKFAFDFCGQRYRIGVRQLQRQPDALAPAASDFSETIAEMLTGPPRIAGLWDDLNAGAAPGSVTFSETSRSFTVSFTNVPEFLNTAPTRSRSRSSRAGAAEATATGTMTATVGSRRRRDRGRDRDGRFTISYGDLSATDGLAGYSCGGRITSGFEQETDLSKAARRTIDGDGETAIFEIFNAVPGDNDLDNRRLEFEGPGRFRDVFEPNDSAGADVAPRPEQRADTRTTTTAGEGWCACRSIPPHRFSDISPLGDDVDFFRFRAKAGDILAIETVPGLSEHGHRPRHLRRRGQPPAGRRRWRRRLCCRGCWCRSPWTARMPWACRRTRT